jgi:hypothetical protein
MPEVYYEKDFPTTKILQTHAVDQKVSLLCGVRGVP